LEGCVVFGEILATVVGVVWIWKGFPLNLVPEVAGPFPNVPGHVDAAVRAMVRGEYLPIWGGEEVRGKKGLEGEGEFHPKKWFFRTFRASIMVDGESGDLEPIRKISLEKGDGTC
jgi:hypothetical protein